MAGTRNDISDPQPGKAGVRDDFSAETHAEGEERRLHLRAFDYWLSLKGELEFPLFKDLRPEGLAPYRHNSLLLELTEGGAIVRYVGDHISMLVDAPIAKGTNLSAFPDSAFAQALLGQFDTDEGRGRAVEFEFVEDLLDCRGIMLPFSHTGLKPHFSMVVVNFRRREGLEHVETFALEEAVSSCERAAGQVVHLDGGSRGSLYRALAAAFALHEEAERTPDAFKALLKEAGLKQQKRAPFTPALKLTFGKDYDKTRLTEYAAALAYAKRNGVAADGLAEFLEKEPGGIKGCVREERAARRGESGTASATLQQKAEAALAAAPEASLESLKTDTEFCLVIARPKEGGGLEAIGVADVGQNTIDAAIRRHAEKIKTP
ncbi:MAG: hypothetical protein HWE25_12240 [Alphaproteobacteria bacterium]|nr:hypothetical protein [Alphaproteobacteria bacterium]